MIIKIKLLTALVFLFNCNAFAQHGHSVNSNSIIHQQPKTSGVVTANTNANSNTGSNKAANSQQPEKTQAKNEKPKDEVKPKGKK